MLKTLQSLRFLFALLIFLSHFDYAGTPLLASGGDCGVAFFLCLSGFLLAKKHGESIDNRTFSHRRFLLKRLAAIYPLHLLCLVASLLLWPQPLDWKVLANLLLVQSWIPDADCYFGCNSVSWFLSAIMFGYIVFPWLYRAKVRWLLPAMATAYLTTVLLVPEADINRFLYVNPLVRTVDLYVGISLWRLGRHIGKLPRPTLLEALCLAMVAVALASYPHVAPKFGNAPLYWLAVAPVLLVFSEQSGWFSRVLGAGGLVALGNLSLPFFMTHKMVIALVLGALRHAGFRPPSLAVLAICLLLALLVSWLVDRWFLRPIQGLAHRRRQ